MAGLAFQALLRMIGMPEIIGDIRMTCGAGLAANRGGARNLDILGKRVDDVR